MPCVYHGCHLKVVGLYRSTTAIAFNDSVKLASRESRYSHCSNLFIDRKLVEINHFVQCTVFLTNPASSDCTTYTHWLVHCTSYMNHSCKPWYGYPTQFWASLNADFIFFFVHEITSRVVFVKTNVNFGRHIG